ELLQPVERTVRTKEGLAFLVQILPYRTMDDRIDGVVLTFMDITERERAEHAVRESEEQFRRAIEDAPIPVIMHAEDGQVLQISNTWTELTGHCREEIPTFEAWLNTAYGHGTENVRDHVHGLFEGNKRQNNVDLDFKT